MKIQFASDLHLEFYLDKDEDIFPTLVDPSTNADLLILAGDIGYPDHYKTMQFFTWCCALWPQVVWIYGNHEYYTCKSHDSYFLRSINGVDFERRDKSLTMKEKRDLAEIYREKFKNLNILLTDSVTINGFRIIGATLWTNIPQESIYPIQKYMNDFRMILVEDGVMFNTSDWSNEHKKDYSYIESQLKEAEEKNENVIVVTHHLPTYKMCLPQYEEDGLNPAFMTHADPLLEHPSVALWICGHSHGQKTMIITKRNGEQVECCMNSLGYPYEDSTTTYDNKKCIELV